MVHLSLGKHVVGDTSVTDLAGSVTASHATAEKDQAGGGRNSRTALASLALFSGGMAVSVSVCLLAVTQQPSCLTCCIKRSACGAGPALPPWACALQLNQRSGLQQDSWVGNLFGS